MLGRITVQVNAMFERSLVGKPQMKQMIADFQAEEGHLRSSAKSVVKIL